MAKRLSLSLSPSPLPLYAQIKEALRARILDGSYGIHAQMPSESELMHRFSVSRITVRQALSDLCQEGLIFKVQGKGSYVSKPKVSQSLTTLQGLGEAMGQAGHGITSQVLGFRSLTPDPDMVSRLKLAPDAMVGEIRRVRYVDGAPLSLDVSYFPETIAYQLLEQDLETRDVFVILETELGYRLGHAELEMGAMLADSEIAAALAVVPGAPILRLDRLTYDEHGYPLDYEHLYCRGDQLQYRLRIGRHQSPSRSHV
ncbi:MAG: GntR family transcriptional regulator [Acidiferrobacter sp.]